MSKRKSEKREIVFVYGRHENGGAQRRAITLANEFVENGYIVSIVATRGTVGGTTDKVFYDIDNRINLVMLPEYAEEHKNDTDVLKDISRRNKKIKLLKRLSYIFKVVPFIYSLISEKVSELRRGEKLREFLLKHKNAIVISFGIASYENVFYASKKLGQRLIYAEINNPAAHLPKARKKRNELIKLISKANVAIFQTEAEKLFYKNKLRNKGIVIHNPIRDGLPTPFLGERKKNIVNFCRLSPQKNIPLLIKAFEMLHRDYPDYTLDIFGNAVSANEIAYREKIVEIINTVSCSEAIHLLPPKKDVHHHVVDCTMFVSSSDYEGLSNSMLEAMAIGLPCVCTDCDGGGAREMIKNGYNGLLVEKGNAESLYNGMKRYIEDYEFASECGKNAAKVRYELLSDNIAKQWLDVIERV